jgi:tetratricopeptide (TPR) repeat protein
VIELLLAAEQAAGLGHLDQAERIYRQVLDADPRSSIALAGLARVALDGGDDGQALALATGALDIDPQNATAIRIVERLAAPRQADPAEPAPAEPAPPEPAPVVTEAGPPVALTPRRGILRRLLGRS